MPSTLTVTSTADSGGHSLRAEIAAAHNGDTIQFASGLDGQTIILTKGELLINKNLTITGFGDRGMTVSGNNHSRVFEVAAGMQVHMSGLTISDGLAKAGDGGGILVDAGAILTLSNSTLSGNAASFNRKGIGGKGGGIDNSGTLTVSNCILSGNTTQFPDGAVGGRRRRHLQPRFTLTVNNNSSVSGNDTKGIVNFGSATVSDSIVSDNSQGGIFNASGATVTVSDSFLCRNKSGYEGGAIENDGTATIIHCTLADNSAVLYGGGIWSKQGFLTIIDCTLTDNTAQNLNGHGGGIEILTGTATITNCTLSGNSATSGGGIYASTAARWRSATARCPSNSAWDGGGICVLSNAKLTVNHSNVSGNSAQRGGGILISGGGSLPDGMVTVENYSSIVNNLAPAGYSADDVNNWGELYQDSTSTHRHPRWQCRQCDLGGCQEPSRPVLCRTVWQTATREATVKFKEAVGEVQPPGMSLTGPARLRRSVCAGEPSGYL